MLNNIVDFSFKWWFLEIRLFGVTVHLHLHEIFIFRMTNVHSNIPSSTFHPLLWNYEVWDRSYCKIVIFCHRRMERRGGNRGKLVKQIMKACGNYQLVFQKYDVSNRDISRTNKWLFLGYRRGRKYCISVIGKSLSRF